MPTTASAYFSYLLRLWLAGDDGRPEWRIALIDPQTGERRGFISLEAMTAFLQDRMEAATPSQAMNFIATPPNRSADLGEVGGGK